MRYVVLGLIYRLVAFDLDGTLVDSLADLTSAVNAALADEGVAPLSRDEVVRFIGNGARNLVAGSLRARGGEVSEDRVSRALGVFQRCYDEVCLDQTVLYEGMEELLDALVRRGVLLAVLTNKPAAFARKILGGLGVDGYFERVVGGDDLPTRKPSPEGLLQLVEMAGVSAPQAILVGDSTVDLETARNARVDSCAVSWGFVASETLRAAGPTHLVATAAELRAVLSV